MSHIKYDGRGDVSSEGRKEKKKKEERKRAYIKSPNGRHIYTSVAASVLEPWGVGGGVLGFSGPLRILPSHLFCQSLARTLARSLRLRKFKKKKKKRWRTKSEKCSGAFAPQRAWKRAEF